LGMTYKNAFNLPAKKREPWSVPYCPLSPIVLPSPVVMPIFSNNNSDIRNKLLYAPFVRAHILLQMA
jgi:hypothetical protein